MTHTPVSNESDQFLLVGQIADEFAERMAHGEQPQIEEYAAKHPEIAETLRRVLPALEMMGELSAHDRDEPAEFEEIIDSPERVLGDFRLLGEIGRGGMGVVYEAEQISLSRRVALKVLPFVGVLDSKQLQRFRNESRAVAGLHHPHIVPIYAVGSDRGVHFYAMQFIEGRTLEEMIAELASAEDPNSKASLSELVGSPRETLQDDEKPSGSTAPTAEYVPAGDDPRPQETPDTQRAAAAPTHSTIKNPKWFRTVAQIGIQVAQALDHAHSVGVTHRDIKPSNLIVDNEGKVWVADFGLAQMEADAGITETGDVLGTLRYMSPEQARGDHRLADHRSDIYSLGVTLMELLTLQPAFPGENRQQVLRAVTSDDPLSVRRLNRSVPRDLETIILKAAAKSPQDRFRTAEELAQDLQRFLDLEAIVARPPTLLKRFSKWIQRHRAVVSTAVVVVVLSLIAGAVLVTRENADTRAALAAERAQRQRAEKNLGQAHAAVNELLSTPALEKMLNQPRLAPIAQEMLEKALKITQKLLDKNAQSLDARYQAAMAYDRMGVICRLLGQDQSAHESCQQAIARCEALVNEWPTNSKFRKGLARGYDTYGFLLLRLRQFSKARATYAKSLEIYQAMHKKSPENEAFRQTLAKTYSNLGAAFAEDGRLADAEKALRQAVALRGDSDLFHLNLGECLRQLGRLHEADRHLRTALKLCREPNHDRRPGIRATLALVFADQQQLQKAVDQLQQAVSESEQVVARHPDFPEWREELAGYAHNLAMYLSRLGRLKESVQMEQRSMDAYEQLKTRFPNNQRYTFEWARSGAIVINRLLAAAKRLAEEGNISQGERFYSEATEIASRFMDVAPIDPQIASTLGATLNNVAIALRGRGLFVESTAMLEKAVRYQQMALQSDPQNPTFRRFLRNHYSGLAFTNLHLKDHRRLADTTQKMSDHTTNPGWDHQRGMYFVAACIIWAQADPALDSQQREMTVRAYGEQTRELVRRAIAFYPTAHVWSNLAWRLAADNDQTRPSPDQALGWAAERDITLLVAVRNEAGLRDRALLVAMARRAMELDPVRPHFWRNLGRLHALFDEHQKAVEALQESEKRIQALDPTKKPKALKPGEPALTWLLLAMAHHRLGQAPKAIQYYQQAIQWIEQHKPAIDDLDRVRVKAAKLLGMRPKTPALKRPKPDIKKPPLPNPRSKTANFSFPGSPRERKVKRLRLTNHRSSGNPRVEKGAEPPSSAFPGGAWEREKPCRRVHTAK